MDVVNCDFTNSSLPVKSPFFATALPDLAGVLRVPLETQCAASLSWYTAHEPITDHN